MRQHLSLVELTDRSDFGRRSFSYVQRLMRYVLSKKTLLDEWYLNLSYAFIHCINYGQYWCGISFSSGDSFTVHWMQFIHLFLNIMHHFAVAFLDYSYIIITMIWGHHLWLNLINDSRHSMLYILEPFKKPKNKKIKRKKNLSGFNFVLVF